MLHKDEILSLRDLALEHLPKVREQRDLMSKHGRNLALQAVAGGPLKTFYNAASTAIEKRAAALLDLVHKHPDTTTEGLYPAECEMGAALQAVLLSDARKMQPAIEAAMLEDARLLCRIAGTPLPVWMDGSELQPAPVEAVDASDARTTQSNFMKKVALIAELEYEWPSIVANMSDATRNGLKVAAHTGRHGEWDRDKARAWAVSKGKIKKAAPVHSLAAVWTREVTRHTINH